MPGRIAGLRSPTQFVRQRIGIGDLEGCDEIGVDEENAEADLCDIIEARADPVFDGVEGDEKYGCPGQFLHHLEIIGQVGLVVPKDESEANRAD